MMEDISGLDPCCMREIIDRKKAATLREKLRKVDRSDNRAHTKKAVFTDTKKFHICSCCKNASDYPLLEEMRKTCCLSANLIATEESESDDELDGFVSEYELTMKAKFEANKVKLDNFDSTYGFGHHRNESVDHLELCVQLGFPIICHICSDTDVRSALLDIALEIIAKAYRGTKFRRIYRNDLKTR